MFLLLSSTKLSVRNKTKLFQWFKCIQKKQQIQSFFESPHFALAVLLPWRNYLNLSSGLADLYKCPQHIPSPEYCHITLPPQYNVLHVVIPFLRVWVCISSPSEHRDCFCIELWACFSAFLWPCVGVFLAYQHNKFKHFWLHMFFSDHCYAHPALFSY